MNTSRPINCSPQKPCNVYGCPWDNYPDGSNKQCIGMENILNINKLDDDLSGETMDREIFLNFEYVIGSSINGRKFKQPQVSLLTINYGNLLQFITGP